MSGLKAKNQNMCGTQKLDTEESLLLKIRQQDIFLKNWKKGGTFLEPMSVCRGHVILQSGYINVSVIPLFYGQVQFRLNSHQAMTYVGFTFSCGVARKVLHIFQ